MEIKAYTEETSKNEYTIFGDLNYKDFNHEAWSKIEKEMLSKSKNGDITISGDLRNYFKIKLNFPYSSKELSERFGKNWTLKIIRMGEPYEDKDNYVLTVSYQSLNDFLLNDAENLSKLLKKGLANERRAKTTSRPETKERNTVILKNSTFYEYAKNTENIKELINKTIVNSDNSLINSTTNSQRERVKIKAKELFSKKNIPERKIQNFILENKEILFSNGTYVTSGSGLSNVFADYINKSLLDILVLNKYGVAEVIELKKYDDFVLKYDKSHNKFIPTSKTAAAISQLNNYLRIISRNENDEAKKIGIKKGYEPFSQGTLIIGNNNELYKKGSKVLFKMSDDEINEKARAELISLSFNQKNIRIITYDDFIELSTKYSKD